MNVLVNFRANTLGNLVPSKTQRQAAIDTVTATLRAKLQGSAKALTTKAASPTQKAAVPGAAIAGDDLSKDAFLQLLVLQMQHQDPLDPVDNTEMIAQLAQFSSLEQMTNLNASFGQMLQSFDYLSGNIDQLNFISAQGMLGNYVEGIQNNGTRIQGTVEAIQLEGSIVVLTVDGQLLPMSGVLAIAPTAPEETPVEDGT